MSERLYVNGRRSRRASLSVAERAVLEGKRVVVVDGACVPVEITPKNLKPKARK